MHLVFHCCGYTLAILWLLLSKYDFSSFLSDIFCIFSFAEGIVLFVFVLLAVLWITRNPVFVPGWGTLFRDK